MNILYKWGASALLVLSTSFAIQAQSVGIGTGTPDQSAKLHIESTDKGLLIPQISLGNVNNAAPVTAPAVGLLVWNTNNATTGGAGRGFYYWNGTQWERLSTSSGTDDQNLTGATLAGNNLTITIENGAPTTVDLSSLVNDADAVIGNEYNTNFALSGRNLTISDGGGNRTVDLTSLVNDADAVIGNEYNTGFALSGRNLTITDGGGARTVDLTSLVNDADAVIGNEYNTGFALSGTNLTITDGGGARTVNLAGLNESGRNGLRNVGNFIHLGGPLIENTTVTAGTFAMNFNLNSTGDFNIQDNGVNKFAVLDVGTSRFGGDVEWRDENTGGTLLGQFIDDGDDGRFIVRENGVVSIDLDANTHAIFNEQGLNRDFRIESDINPSAFHLDASTDRIGMGTGTPAEDLHVFRADTDVARVYATGAAQGSGMFYAGQSPTFGGGFVYDGDNAPALVGGTDRITFFRRDNNVDTDVLSYGYNNSTVRVSSLAGGGNRMVIANANGDLFTQAIPANGDITGVNAGVGLTGGGTAGTVTLNAAADNGLYVNAGADRIRLGGNLVENTTITGNTFQMVYNLNNTGDFHIQDNGVNHFSALDNGDVAFGGDVYWRDENTGGTILGQMIDDGNDGRFIVRENGGVSVDLDANTQFIFNEQGLDRDFRIESDTRANMVLLDASENLLRVGNDLFGETGNGTTVNGIVVDYVADFDNGVGATGTAIGIGSVEYLLDLSSETAINNRFSPTRDNIYDLGSAALRWDDVYATNGTIVTSDEREKMNIQPMSYGLSEIMQLRPVTYKWKRDRIGSTVLTDSDKEVKLGLIAQEVQQVLPEVVQTHDWKVKSEEQPDVYTREPMERLGMSYHEITPVLVKAIQEQQQQIEALKAEIKELKAAKK